jgi:hypothetical protein
MDRAELVDAAERLERTHPAAAAILRDAAAEAEGDVDRVTDRRRALRRIKHLRFHFTKPRPAAEAIADAWVNLPPPGKCLPNSLSGDLDKLRRAGHKPIGWRQIFEDLED